MRQINLTGLLIVAILGLSRSAYAEASKDYAIHGKQIVSAFMCSAVAGELKNKEEANRLFKLGYESGKFFLEAVNTGKVQNEDIDSIVPMIVTLRMRGPSIDFILGTIWDGTVSSFFDERDRKCEDCILDAARNTMWMGDKYRSMNCELLN